MRKLAVQALLAAATVTLPAFAQVADKKEDLTGVQAAYQADLAEIEGKYGDLSAKVIEEYSRAISVLEQASTKKGNLEDVVALRAEQARCEKQRALPENALVKSPVELRKLQEKFCQRLASLEGEKNKAVARTAGTYIIQLEKLKKSMTQSAKVDEALRVDAEIEKVKKGAGSALVTPKNGNARRKPIPAPALEHDGHHYLVLKEKMTWHQARQACEALGGHLVVITDQGESDFVNSLVQGRDLWIGLHDAGQLGQWRWVDGSRPVFQGPWGRGKPDNEPGNENCAFLKPGYGPIHWDDIAQHATLGCVCEWDY